MPLIHNDPKYWRKRSQDALTKARKMTDLTGKALMVAIAESYDNLAKQAKVVFRHARKTRAGGRRQQAL